MGALPHKVVGWDPPWLLLPGGVGRQRRVGIAPETAFHIVSRRPGQLKLLLAHMRTVLEEAVARTLGEDDATRVVLL